MLYRITITITSLILTMACSLSPTGRRQLTLMPEAQLAKMGDQSFEQMQKQQQLSADPKVIKRINCISQRIVSSMSEDNDFSEWDVKVFEDKAINAFATPGKNIGVFTGLVDAAKSNDQIAAVIGHEVGHVLAKHGNERISQTLIVQGGLVAADIALDSENPRKNQMILAALGVGAQLGILLPYSRKHESEADHIGQNLMAKAGFNPEAAVEFWQIMKQQKNGQPPEFLSTHPAAQSRIDNLNENLKEAQEIYQQNKARFSSCPS
ncbi:MAG: M48 family metallopeptidase [Bacteriovoracaceae bacterium]|nr:M48 family metallopeptidase [Bacteriovoracaceae bacterium]